MTNIDYPWPWNSYISNFKGFQAQFDIAMLEKIDNLEYNHLTNNE